jgi:hypothetical protein
MRNLEGTSQFDSQFDRNPIPLSAVRMPSEESELLAWEGFHSGGIVSFLFFELAREAPKRRIRRIRRNCNANRIGGKSRTKRSGENSRTRTTGVKSRTLRVCLLKITRYLLCHSRVLLLFCH